jgi:proteasome activator subunit 4
VEQF